MYQELKTEMRAEGQRALVFQTSEVDASDQECGKLMSWTCAMCPRTNLLRSVLVRVGIRVGQVKE